MRIALEHKTYLIAVAASFVGAIGRIGYEQDDKSLSKRRRSSFFFFALFVALIIHEFLIWRAWTDAMALFCAIGGIISPEIVRIIIRSLPDMLKKRLGREIAGNDYHEPKNTPNDDNRY